MSIISPHNRGHAGVSDKIPPALAPFPFLSFFLKSSFPKKPVKPLFDIFGSTQSHSDISCHSHMLSRPFWENTLILFSHLRVE